MKKVFSCKAKVWRYQGMAGWHFVTLPHKTSEEINYFFIHAKKGWGSLPVVVTLGKTQWKTSIFPDKKIDSYVLPLKAEVRKKESLQENDTIKFSLEINQ